MDSKKMYMMANEAIAAPGFDLGAPRAGRGHGIT